MANSGVQQILRLFAAALCGGISLSAADAVDFGREIEPILKNRCFKCHGPEEQKSGLRTDQRGTLLRGGDSGSPAIVPGEPDRSVLLKHVRSTDPEERMPPKGDRLSTGQIDLLEKWIAEGAEWPGQMDGDSGKLTTDHWSFQPTEQPGIPTAGKAWQRNAIDAFIFQKLAENGLEPSPETDRTSLLRRVNLVLTGLPPAVESLEAFLNDPRPTDEVYRETIDRLLASERYGERWAQHWIDVIRWAETVGFETNLARPNAWPYRDWLIRSLNADKPWDRMIFEQIAGDTVNQDAALGFLVAGPANLPGQIGRDEESMRQARQDELDEVIRTIGQAFLGVTVGCARCHTHKFDPVTIRDYYSMQAIFAGMEYGDRRLRGEENDQWKAEAPAAAAEVRKLAAELESKRKEFGLRPPIENIQEETFPALETKAVRMEIAATDTLGQASLYEFEIWSAGGADGVSPENVALAANGAIARASGFALENQTRHSDNLNDGGIDRRQDFPWKADKGGPAWIQIDLKEPVTVDRIVWHRGSSLPVDYQINVQTADGSWKPVADTRDRLLRKEDRRKADAIKLEGLSPEQTSELVALITKLKAAEGKLAKLTAGPQVFGARSKEKPDLTWVLKRGDAMSKGDPVAPAIPEIFGDAGLTDEVPDPERRAALAKHLTQSDHPLTPRVIVNRVWHHHFGTGLVETPSDFGKMGGLPSHPELLDWLAAWFVENGWSLKKLHRLIATTATFRQQSLPRENALKLDSGSRLLWRFPPRRIEAEAIRDSILAVSGKLNLQMYGPGFDFFAQRGGLSDYKPHETFDEKGWRRMIYSHRIRMQTVNIFGSFDHPDGGQMTPKRPRSITPVQALSLLNSPFLERQAGFFADRLRAENSRSIPAQVDLAVKLAFSREATDLESEKLGTLAESHGLEQVCRALFNANEFLTIP